MNLIFFTFFFFFLENPYEKCRNFIYLFLQLTAVGKKMASFPLDPRLAKVILIAKDMNCL